MLRWLWAIALVIGFAGVFLGGDIAIAVVLLLTLEACAHARGRLAQLGCLVWLVADAAFFVWRFQSAGGWRMPWAPAIANLASLAVLLAAVVLLLRSFYRGA